MLAYQKGDAAAFECLYHRHKDALFSFLYRSFPREAVIEEIAQETWMAVINRVSQYQPTARFKTWLYQIARNRLADYWRRKDNQHQSMDSVPEPSVNNVEANVLGQDVLTAIGRLPNEQKDALLLHEQGFTYREIADITGALEETVKSRLRYGRKELRAQLGGLA